MQRLDTSTDAIQEVEVTSRKRKAAEIRVRAAAACTRATTIMLSMLIPRLQWLKERCRGHLPRKEGPVALLRKICSQLYCLASVLCR